MTTQCTDLALTSEYELATSPSSTPSIQHVDNTAVRRCRQAYDDAYRAALPTKGSHFRAKEVADTAYRDALPPLLGSANIRRFVACVAQGMLMSVFDCNEGQRLLYAAQVANSALRKASKSHKNPSESAT